MMIEAKISLLSLSLRLYCAEYDQIVLPFGLPCPWQPDCVCHPSGLLGLLRDLAVSDFRRAVLLAEGRRLHIRVTISICTNIEKYAIGQHCNMEKYSNMIRILTMHVSYTELHEHNSHIFQYSSIPELRQLSSCYSLYKTHLEICQLIQLVYFLVFVDFRITPTQFALFSV